jgi:serine protease Do
VSYVVQAPELDPLSDFVETALSKAALNPVLTRHGSQNWSFHAGNAPVKVWCCCSEHLNFSASIAQTPSKQLNDVFQYLLANEHQPFQFDLIGSTIRLNHIVHTSDVFQTSEKPKLNQRVVDFVAKARDADALLIDQKGCAPSPESLRVRS